MAEIAKKYLDLTGLQAYDALIKAYADAGDAKAIKTVLLDGDNIKFYRKENATTADTADYTIAISSSDVTALKTRVGMTSTLNSYESATNLTDIMNILTGSSSTTGSVAKIASDEADAAETAAKGYTDTEIGKLDADLDASGTAAHSGTFVVSGVTQTDGKLTAVDSVEVEAAGAAAQAKTDLIGTDQDSSSANTIWGAKKYAEVVAENEAAIAVNALDVNEFALASVSNDVVTIKGIKEVDGKIAIGDGAGIALEEVAYTGAAEDVSYANTTSGLTATNVQAAIDEVVGGLGTAAAADVATTAIQEQSTDDGLVSAEQVATFVAAEIAGLEGAMHFVGVITRQSGETDAQAIARVVPNPESGDVVVMSDNAKEYIYDGTTWREVGDEGLYVQKTTTIAGVDLQDDITKSELQTALELGSAAYENTTAFDAAGAAATAKSEVIGTDQDLSSANTIYGAKAYADGAASSAVAALDGSATIASHNGTTGVVTIKAGISEVDGVVSQASGDDITFTAVSSAEINALFPSSTPTT